MARSVRMQLRLLTQWHTHVGRQELVCMQGNVFREDPCTRADSSHMRMCVWRCMRVCVCVCRCAQGNVLVLPMLPLLYYSQRNGEKCKKRVFRCNGARSCAASNRRMITGKSVLPGPALLLAAKMPFKPVHFSYSQKWREMRNAHFSVLWGSGRRGKQQDKHSPASQVCQSQPSCFQPDRQPAKLFLSYYGPQIFGFLDFWIFEFFLDNVLSGFPNTVSIDEGGTHILRHVAAKRCRHAKITNRPTTHSILALKTNHRKWSPLYADNRICQTLTPPA